MDSLCLLPSSPSPPPLPIICKESEDSDPLPSLPTLQNPSPSSSAPSSIHILPVTMEPKCVSPPQPPSPFSGPTRTSPSPSIIPVIHSPSRWDPRSQDLPTGPPLPSPPLLPGDEGYPKDRILPPSPPTADPEMLHRLVHTTRFKLRRTHRRRAIPLRKEMVLIHTHRRAMVGLHLATLRWQYAHFPPHLHHPSTPSPLPAPPTLLPKRD
ncbi:MAG: hypothetical protein DHS80DRAFT_25345 [Piptocephalis tieghemiana]|nr:MAG: hypothetical protein DHS80DRAFT_25345 [Piptocephalis tieghemiana]